MVGTGPYGTYVEAEDILGEDEDGEDEEAQDEHDEGESVEPEEGESEEDEEDEEDEGDEGEDEEDTEGDEGGEQEEGEEHERAGVRQGDDELRLLRVSGTASPSGPAARPLVASEWEQRPGSSRHAKSEGPQEVASGIPTPEVTVESAAEREPLVLPPAPLRNSISRDSTRKSSNHEASTSGSGTPQSASSLPPINQRNGSQPSRKGSYVSSQDAARRSQAGSPQLGSPSRSSTGVSRYYQAPPPPPPPAKPKPREKHDVSAVDPLYLQTAVYRTVPNVGRVYDWKLQHDVNQALSKQRKQQAQMEKVMEAARVQLHVREANERAFQQWVATKKLEKQQQDQENRRIAYVTSVYRSLAREDPAEHKAREAMWVSNFGSKTGAPSNRLLFNGQEGDPLEHFRL